MLKRKNMLKCNMLKCNNIFEFKKIDEYAKLYNRVMIQNNCQLKGVECAICLDSVFCRKIIYLPCKHYFHYDCLCGAVENKLYTCPLCRFNLVTPLLKAGFNFTTYYAVHYNYAVDDANDESEESDANDESDESDANDESASESASESESESESDGDHDSVTVNESAAVHVVNVVNAFNTATTVNADVDPVLDILIGIYEFIDNGE